MYNELVRIESRPTIGVPPVKGPACLALTLLGCLLNTATAQKIQYNRDVRPILAENCFACHGFDAATREAGLRLDTRAGAVEPLESGQVAVVPSDISTSELVKRILTTDDDLRMPPPSSNKKLTAAQIDILQQWIKEGAEYEKHWAFIPPALADMPSVSARSHNPIDVWVESKLANIGLKPSPSADPIVLLRRLYFDLVGLPPAAQDVDRFLVEHADAPEKAYANQVERLLQSPRYGERWGRWWLDQARYADSNGYSIDAPRQIWKFRDWVIDALNRDLPFDQFTVEQLAGDLLSDATDDQIIATGFHRNTQINQEGGIDQEQFRIDSVFDRVATTGTVWLGLTIGCAQCHNHKFDPIEQREYYQLFAFFNNQEEPVKRVYDPELRAGELLSEQSHLTSLLDAKVAEAMDAIKAWESGLDESAKEGLAKDIQAVLKNPKRSKPQWRNLYVASIGKDDGDFQTKSERLRSIEQKLESATTTLVMKELPKPRKTNIFIKGDFTRPAEAVTCGTPAVLHPLEINASTSNRLDLARWIASPSNPLTPRVLVNRVWQQYFGRGLVESENDFGLQGSAPSHPELLDWLAIDFVRQGWSLKALHRRIVMSQTYQQSSVETQALVEKDRDNVWLSRQRRLRLDAELVRDAALAASGLLTSKMFGPPVYPPIPEGVMGQGQVKREWKASEGEDRFRRAMYTFLYRATPPPSLNVFDSPDGFSSCTRRIRSNTPLQALTLMNDRGFFEFAQALAKLIEHEGLANAFQRCTSRVPTDEELAVLGELDHLSAARVLLNLDETLTRE